MEKQIASRVIKTELIEWRKLNFIQDEDFKEWVDSGDQKLLQSLAKYQFIDPFKVWEHHGILYCLDGKHRWKDLNKVVESGVMVPDQLPATFIDCLDITEAAELVLVYSSAYARITMGGLFNFISKFELSLPSVSDVISIPDINLQQFEQRFDQFQDEDEIEFKRPENIIIKEGDIFKINGHVIVCGDSTDKHLLDKMIDKEKISLLFTSPPYNMNGGLYDEYQDNLSANKYLELNLSVVSNFMRHLNGYVFYNLSYNKNSRSNFIDIFYNLKELKGLRFLELIVWNKKTAIPITSSELLTRQFEQIAVLSTDDMINDMELFYLGSSRKEVFFNKRIGKTMSNYWEIPVNTSKVQFENHSACFPIELPKRAIQLTTKEGEYVADSFLGMGTTLLACESLKRYCIGFELQPLYLQGTINRYLNYCSIKNIEVNFSHLNGTLTLNDFINGTAE